MAEDIDEEEEEPGYESGPFCKHYGQVGECEEVCALCGHQCRNHDPSEPYDCDVDGCTCEGFVDEKEALDNGS